MPYCDEIKLKARFGEAEVDQLLDRNNDESADEGALDAVVADVDGLINGYLRGRYIVPVTEENEFITGVACDIVRYRLYDNKAPEEVAARNKQAIQFLEKVSTGQIILSLPTPTAPGMTSTQRTREFTDETLANFMGNL